MMHQSEFDAANVALSRAADKRKSLINIHKNRYTATLTEVCSDVCVEPHLQPLSGESLRYSSAIKEDGARLDIRANGFWGNRYQQAFFDIRVFNPNASSYRQLQPTTAYNRQEQLKRRHYEQRVREVEHGSFTPLVFSTSGGLSKAAEVTYKRLASLIAEKRDTDYSTTRKWLRNKISFSLLRSAITCLRGARSKHFEQCYNVKFAMVFLQCSCLQYTVPFTCKLTIAREQHVGHS